MPEVLAPPAAPATAPACHARSAALLDLPRIFEPAIQVCQWDRTAPPELDAWLDAHPESAGSGFRAIVRPGDPVPLDGPGASPREPGLELLHEDIRFLAELFAELLGCPLVAARLEVIASAMCPRFHVDHTGIRLLCTYRGPGTEWLAEADADRSRLGPGHGGLPDATSGLLRPGASIRSIPRTSVALLKGDLWQGNAGRGAIHRSPAIAPAEAPRILLALDAVWEERWES